MLSLKNDIVTIKIHLLTYIGEICGSFFARNQSTYRELSVGGVLVKTCIIAFIELFFLKKNSEPSHYSFY